ncbi:MAG TPA: hypothetical protein VIE65_21205 [Methylobacter sp.]
MIENFIGRITLFAGSLTLSAKTAYIPVGIRKTTEFCVVSTAVYGA